MRRGPVNLGFEIAWGNRAGDRVSGSRRWRVTAFGHSVMGAAIKLRQDDFSRLYPAAA